MSKMFRFRGYFERQHGKRAQALSKSTSQHIYDVQSSLARKLCFKKSFLLTCEILGMLVNTLAIDEKYLVLYRDNLTIPIQMLFLRNKKRFLCFLLHS